VLLTILGTKRTSSEAAPGSFPAYRHGKGIAAGDRQMIRRQASAARNRPLEVGADI